MKEIWKDIENYEGLYQISSLGRVKSLERRVKNGSNSFMIRKERILKPYKLKTGYLAIDLYNENVKKITIHRLVAENFIENKECLPEVDHINRVKTDNNLKNLRWASRSTNSRNCVKCENSTSTYNGVSYVASRKKWQVTLRSKRKNIYIGQFSSEIKAAIEFDKYCINNNINRELNLIY